MHTENPPNDILIYRRPKREVDLLGNAWAAPVRIALLHLNDRADDIRLWTLWALACSCALAKTTADISVAPTRDGNSTKLKASQWPHGPDASVLEKASTTRQ
jgi:hypothetical protein